MAVSLSFMLPIGKFCLLNRIWLILSSIATPPNAMIFVNGNMKTRDLLKAGFGAKIIGIIVIFFASLVLISPIFHINDIIPISNSTLMTNITNG
jgi:hypothetical protein